MVTWMVASFQTSGSVFWFEDLKNNGKNIRFKIIESSSIQKRTKGILLTFMSIRKGFNVMKVLINAAIAFFFLIGTVITSEGEEKSFVDEMWEEGFRGSQVLCDRIDWYIEKYESLGYRFRGVGATPIWMIYENDRMRYDLYVFIHFEGLHRESCYLFFKGE